MDKIVIEAVFLFHYHREFANGRHLTLKQGHEPLICSSLNTRLKIYYQLNFRLNPFK
jgi:hypothetical protein